MEHEQHDGLIFSATCKACRDEFRAMLAAIGLEDRGFYPYVEVPAGD